MPLAGAFLSYVAAFLGGVLSLLSPCSGLLLIGFGLLEVFGAGVSAVRAPRALQAAQGQRGAAAVYATGLVYGMAGFCAGPLLGGVLTLAAAEPNPLTGAALLVTYALGTTAPL